MRYSLHNYICHILYRKKYCVPTYQELTGIPIGSFSLISRRGYGPDNKGTHTHTAHNNVLSVGEHDVYQPHSSSLKAMGMRMEHVVVTIVYSHPRCACSEHCQNDRVCMELENKCGRACETCAWRCKVK